MSYLALFPNDRGAIGVLVPVDDSTEAIVAATASRDLPSGTAFKVVARDSLSADPATLRASDYVFDLVAAGV